MKIGYDPFGERQTYIYDQDSIERAKIAENKAWMSGDPDEILNYFLDSSIYEIPQNPVYSRNRQEFFWCKSQMSGATVRRIHSGLCKAAIETISNVVGLPMFVSADGSDGELKELVRNSRINEEIIKRGRPLTLGLGRGCYKISRFPGDDFATVEFYEADRCKMHWVGNRMVTAEFFDWYRKEDCYYLLVDTRGVDIDGAYSDKALYRMDQGRYKGNRVPLTEIAETAMLSDREVLPGYRKILAEPYIIFDDPLNPHGGRSINQGKGAILDALDESLSIQGMTVRFSMPIEYIPVDCLERRQNGSVVTPNPFSRHFVLTSTPMIADPTKGNDRIQITQPNLATDEYIKTNNEYIYRYIEGFLSPATIGILADRDNPNMSREREKTTIFTRNSIVEVEQNVYRNVIEKMMDLTYPGVYHKVQVRFAEFANPSLENEIAVLGGAWSQGQISTNLYVQNLWKDRLTDQEMEEEKQALEDYRDKTLFAPLAYEGDNTNGNWDIGSKVSGQGKGGKDQEGAQEGVPSGAGERSD